MDWMKFDYFRYIHTLHFFEKWKAFWFIFLVKLEIADLYLWALIYCLKLFLDFTFFIQM